MTQVKKHHKQLILASSSPARRELLERLGLDFFCVSPGLDESARTGEPPEQMVFRLAEEKALRVAGDYPEALIIGSDQVATLDGQVLTKPGTHSKAVEQLEQASGRQLCFLTAVCLLNASTGKRQTDVIPFKVEFRTLAHDQIENYLRREQPYQCAGAFKSEALGIALFNRLDGNDPTALVGLPLIRLIQMLETEGCAVL